VSDTPRTEAAWKPDGGDGYPTVDVDVARQLERELNAANERIKRLEESRTVVAANSLANMLSYEDAITKIKRLEEAGDAMAAWLSDPKNLGGGVSMASQWNKAKEAKL